MEVEKGDRLYTPRQWAEEKEWPPIGGLRHLIYNSDHNGFDKVFLKVRNRILISEKAFNRWLYEQNKISKGKGA